MTRFARLVSLLLILPFAPDALARGICACRGSTSEKAPETCFLGKDEDECVDQVKEMAVASEDECIARSRSQRCYVVVRGETYYHGALGYTKPSTCEPHPGNARFACRYHEGATMAEKGCLAVYRCGEKAIFYHFAPVPSLSKKECEAGEYFEREHAIGVAADKVRDACGGKPPEKIPALRWLSPGVSSQLCRCKAKCTHFEGITAVSKDITWLMPGGGQHDCYPSLGKGSIGEILADVCRSDDERSSPGDGLSGGWFGSCERETRRPHVAEPAPRPDH